MYILVSFYDYDSDGNIIYEFHNENDKSWNDFSIGSFFETAFTMLCDSLDLNIRNKR